MVGFSDIEGQLGGIDIVLSIFDFGDLAEVVVS